MSSRLIVEQLEGEFVSEAHVVEFLQRKEYSHVEDKRADAVSQLEIRTQSVHREQVEIKPFVLNVVGVFHQVAQQEKRCFVSDMAAYVIRRSVVPTSVQGLEYSAYVVVPSSRQVVFPEIDEVHEVGFLLVGERSKAHPIIQA